VVMKRGKKGAWYIYFRPFKTEKIGLRVDVKTKSDAEQIEGVLLRACRTWHFSGLDEVVREAAIRLFQNQGWELPEVLNTQPQQLESPKKALTLWQAAQLFIKSPEIANCQERVSYEAAFTHLVQYFKKDACIKDLWIPEIKGYIVHRINEGAAPATVNREKGTLSKMFKTLLEHRLVETNPVRMIPNLSQKSGERQVYLSLSDVQRIVQACPVWYQRLIWASYYSGMRRGELLSMTRKHLDLSKRIITLTPENTKEAHWKRIPIHKELLQVLEDAMRVSYLGSDKVFLLQDRKGIRPIGVEATKNPWERACLSLGLAKPRPRFHDLRHTWRSNARRSGVSDQIAEMILGHALRGKRVDERYGYVSDEELVAAIDKMTFENGTTQILVASARQR